MNSKGNAKNVSWKTNFIYFGIFHLADLITSEKKNTKLLSRTDGKVRNLKLKFIKFFFFISRGAILAFS